MSKMRGHIASGHSCPIHGDNGCEIQGEAGSLERAGEKRRLNKEIEEELEDVFQQTKMVD